MVSYSTSGEKGEPVGLNHLHIFYGKLFSLTPDASAYVLCHARIVKLKGETCSKSHSGV